MCRFKSALVLKDRVFVPDYDSHDRMLEELKIPDDFAHASKVFVRVELSPADGDVASDPMGWKIKIDQDILPDWFVHAVDEQRVKVAITEWCKVHVLREGYHEVHDGVWYAYDSAAVKACGSATVTAYDSATVWACGSATVTAYDSATVWAYDSATVTACDSATVKACNSATVTACDSATVTAYGSATVTACDSSTVTAHDSATVTACGSSTVTAHDSATVWAHDSATVTAHDSATVTAYDSATVWAHDSATVILPPRRQTNKEVTLDGEAVCINYKTHTIKSKYKWHQEDCSE